MAEGQAYPAQLLQSDGGTLDGIVGIQFTDDTDQPGGGGGGGTDFLIQVFFEPSVPFLDLGEILVPNTLVGGGSGLGAAARAIATSLPFVVGAMGTVVIGSVVTLRTAGVVPSTADALDLQLFAFVTDATGDNAANILESASVANPVTDTTKTISLAGGNWTISAGTDLTDAGGGTLQSTAGGVFFYSVACAVVWD